MLARLVMIGCCGAMAACAPLATRIGEPPAEAGQTARPGDLQTIVARYFAWRGGADYLRLASFHAVQDVEMMGLRGTYEERRARDGTSLSMLALGHIQQKVWTDSAGSWSQLNGVVSDRAPDQAADVRRLTSLLFGEALLGRGATALLLPAETRSGRSWAVVRVTFEGPDTYDLFIDPQSGELHGYRITRNREARFTTLSDWRLVNGIRFPFVQATTGAHPSDGNVVRVRRVSFNEPIDPALGVRPEGRRVAFFADGRASTGPLPFNFLNGNRIYIPARVNGRSVEVLLDSGADFTALDRAFAQVIGLQTFGQTATGGVGGQSQSTVGSDVMIEIANLRLDHPTVGVLDLSSLAGSLSAPVPVILGRPAFERMIVDIDFAGKTIAFHDPAQFQVPAGVRTVELRRVGPARAVPVSIEGGREVQAQFDLGNSAYFEVFPVYWQPHRMLEGRRQSTGHVSGIGGSVEETDATLRSLDFAGERFLNVPASFGKPGAEHDDDRFSGLIGLSILSRFRLLIDYPGDKLHLIPLPDVQTRAFPKNRTGLSLSGRAEGLEVTAVAGGSPAAKSSWRVGDMVTAINGIAVGVREDQSRRPRLNLLPAGERVTFTMRDGSRRTLVLEDYF